VNLTETGESRVNGYLFVLERSLKTFLPAETARDAVREIESHLRERVAVADGAPNERDAVEKMLAELGPPLRVAQAYSAERTIDEAVATGRVVPMLRAVWTLARRAISPAFWRRGLRWVLDHPGVNYGRGCRAGLRQHRHWPLSRGVAKTAAA
jgi:hypothetical protein